MKIGDKVYIDSESSFGTLSKDVVTDISTKYDEDTGKPYNVIHCDTMEFDSRTKYSIKVPYNYYVTSLMPE